MGLFSSNGDRERNMYHRAHHDSDGKPVNPREHEYLNRSLIRYAKEHNCSYDEALKAAKSGKLPEE